MCGIAGVVATGRDGVDHGLLEALGLTLAHRGPDGDGTWVSDDGRVGFAHRRLAVIDLDPRSDQPMRSADGAITVTYNGELYNHRAVRSDLERQGHRFRTTSDTEVLVEALAAWGTAALQRLRGMFAFAAHDARTGEVVLARDALGIKPAYHALTATGDLVFASEVRALRGRVQGGLDPEAAADLLLWGSIAAPRTSVHGVRSLPAGSLLRVRDGRVTEERWAAPVTWWEDSDEDDDAAEERLIEAVRASVRAHLIADVPVAVFLSSGVDSGAIASIAAGASGTSGVTALTVRDPDSDESSAAAARARAFGLPHEVVDVPLVDADALLDDALEALDQPSVDGVNSFVVARAAAQAGFRVALSGVGGDELFGGYPSATWLRTLGPVHRALRPLGWSTASLLGHPRSCGWDRRTLAGRSRWVLAHAGVAHGPYLVVRGVFAPTEVARLLDLDLAEVRRIVEERLGTIPSEPGATAYPSASEADQYLRHQLLRDIDATSMASSVEVRTPLVDAELLAAAAACPQRIRARGPAKAVLRAAALHDLPAAAGPKQGFSVPMQRWVGATDPREHWSRTWLLRVLDHERRRESGDA